MSYIPILYLNNQQLQKIIEVGGQWRDTLQIDEDNMSWAMKAKAAKKGPAGLFGRATGQSGWPVWCAFVVEGILKENRRSQKLRFVYSGLGFERR